jgi:hypothetical protein
MTCSGSSRTATREIEVLPDGRIREASQNGDVRDEAVTRTLKTERTWY